MAMQKRDFKHNRDRDHDFRDRDRDRDSDDKKGPFFGKTQEMQRRPVVSKDYVFDYKDPEMLRQFLTERGKIVPRRLSRLNQKQHNQLVKAIKRARILALLDFTSRRSALIKTTSH